MTSIKVHNIIGHGVVKEWLFDGQEVKFGEDFALISDERGQDVIVKSETDGVIKKIIKVGSKVKNGTILAQVENQEAKIKKITDKVSADSANFDGDEYARLLSAEDEADNFSGAVMYDRNLEAKTPYSNNANDIQTSSVDPNANISTRLSQMRSNIARSIENSPYKPKELSQEELENLTNVSVDEKNASSLLSKDPSSGKSQYRQMIEARKAKLLEEENFKKIDEDNKVPSAMDNLDEDGRPIIFRNIINKRLSEWNNSGGNPHAIITGNDGHPTKPADPKFNAVSKSTQTTTVQTTTAQSVNNFVSSTTNNSVNLVRKPVEKPVVYEESSIIDQNDRTIGGTYLPSKSRNQLVDEISEKSALGIASYTDKKIANLYDPNRRLALLKARGQQIGIQNRKLKMMGLENHQNYQKSVFIGDDDRYEWDPVAQTTMLKEVDRNADDLLAQVSPKLAGESPKLSGGYRNLNNKTNSSSQTLPLRFVNVVPLQNQATGGIEFVPYKDTPAGKKELARYIAELKQNEQSSAVDIEYTAELENVASNIIKGSEKHSFAKDQSNPDLSISKSDIDYLQEEVKHLREQLKHQNKFDQANIKLGYNTVPFANPDAFFDKMLQYWMIHNLLTQNNQKNSNDDETANQIKKFINIQLEMFAKQNNLMTNFEVDSKSELPNLDDPSAVTRELLRKSQIETEKIVDETDRTIMQMEDETLDEATLKRNEDLINTILDESANEFLQQQTDYSPNYNNLNNQGIDASTDWEGEDDVDYDESYQDDEYESDDNNDDTYSYSSEDGYVGQDDVTQSYTQNAEMNDSENEWVTDVLNETEKEVYEQKQNRQFNQLLKEGNENNVENNTNLYQVEQEYIDAEADMRANQEFYKKYVDKLISPTIEPQPLNPGDYYVERDHKDGEKAMKNFLNEVSSLQLQSEMNHSKRLAQFSNNLEKVNANIASVSSKLQELATNQVANSAKISNLNSHQDLKKSVAGYNTNQQLNTKRIYGELIHEKIIETDYDYLHPLTAETKVDLTNLLKFKKKLNEEVGKNGGQFRYSTMAFLVKKLSDTLFDYPELNATIAPTVNEVYVKDVHNIGVATSTSIGLVAPIIKYANKLNLKDIEIALQDITLRLKKGEIFKYQTNGSTITIANHSMSKHVESIPPIFYPNIAVLGIGDIVKTPIFNKDLNATYKRAIMGISVSADRRVIPIDLLRNFLRSYKENLENY